MSKKNEILQEYDFSKGKGGAVIPHKGKTRIIVSLRQMCPEFIGSGLGPFMLGQDSTDK
jgi:hypothetical protein